MKIVQSIAAMQRQSAAWLRAGETVGLVPTLGALHEGHLTHVHRARAECEHGVVSIYVNPTQFGPKEDLARYPRPRARDLALCRRERADVVFAPANLYLPDHSTWVEEAERSISHIEHEVESTGVTLPAVDDSLAIELRPTTKIGYLALTRVLFRDYPRRSVLGAVLMISQSFLYNAIFFTYTLVLGKFYGVASGSAPLYLIAFAVGNLAGPLTLGHFFDTIGRRKMIAGTYLLSGLLLAVSAVLFNAGVLNAVTQTIVWCIIFYFASAGASAAYLTVSEIFPLQVRAKAIAVFFAIAQCFGALGPVIYGALIGEGSQRFPLFGGYLLGAGVMMVGGLVAWFLAVDAEGKSLEDVATPLAAAAAS